MKPGVRSVVATDRSPVAGDGLAVTVDGSLVPGLRSVVPGDGLLHPLALVALAVWAVNDHVLKAQWPGAVTGKLSDVAGLFVFPLVLQAAVEVAGSMGRRQPKLASQRVLAVAIVATAGAFSAVQVSPVAGELYRLVWGWLAWPLAGFPSGRPAGVSLVQDPTDIAVVPVMIVTWYLGRARRRLVDADE